MKLIYKNLRKNTVKLKIESLEDLWHLSNIIDSGDLIKGKTIRKIKIQSTEDKTKSDKRTVFLEISAEKVEFNSFANTLRVLGKITQGPEDVQRGEHHTFNLQPGDVIEIEKSKWLNYHLEKLEQALEQEKSKILILVFDREEGFFAINKMQNYELLTSIQGDVEKKSIDTKVTKRFFPELIKLLEEYNQRYLPEHIIIASPSFWKEDLLREISADEIKRKVVLATCSSVRESAVNEILKRPEVKNVLKRDRISKEIFFVEELLKEINLDGKFTYGLKDTRNAADAGAVETLLVTDNFIKKMRENDCYNAVEQVLKTADKSNGQIIFISSENEAGKKLDSIGGIGAILRYKLNY